MATVAVQSKTLNDLGQTLLAQLSEIVSGGDANVPPPPNSFVTWLAPGIPFDAGDFDFAAKGLGSGATAEDEKRLTQQASDFSRLVDFIPDPSSAYTQKKQEAVFRTSEARMSHMYGEILNASKVVKSDLTAAEKAKIEKFRKLLRTTRKVKDIVTDEEKEVTEDGPVLKAYNEKMSAYLDAALVYNSKRVAAMAATGADGKAAVLDFRTNAQLYRLQVKAAADAWTSGGYRNEVDQMNAYINQVGLRDMVLWKQRLLEMYDDAVLTDAANAKFYYTSVIPGNFANAKGWTRFTTSNESTMSQTRSESSSWSAGAGLSWGLFSFGGNASGQSSKYSSNMAVSRFKLSFELAQAIVSRPWFYPEFFMNRGWTLQPGTGWTFSDIPSDGKRPPKGLFVGYPTTILFARNIVIESAEFASAYSQYSKSVGGGGSVGWGPFRLSGSYRSSSAGTDFASKSENNSVTVPGMQIIGFINHLIGKAPDPLPNLKPADFQ